MGLNEVTEMGGICYENSVHAHRYSGAQSQRDYTTACMNNG